MDNTSDDQSNAQSMCRGGVNNQLLELFSPSHLFLKVICIFLYKLVSFKFSTSARGFQLHLPVTKSRWDCFLG